MREFIGVLGVDSLEHFTSLKQESLIFNRIAIPLIEYVLEETGLRKRNKVMADEIEWLIETGVVFDAEKYRNSKAIENDVEKYRKSGTIVFNEEYRRLTNLAQEQLLRLIDDSLGIAKITKDSDFSEIFQSMFESMTRASSIKLRQLWAMDAYPILNRPINSAESARTNKSDLVQIILNYLPTIDDSVSWEQVLDYRNDVNSQSKFLALRNWMNEIARAELTPVEIEQKLEYLIDQYQQHMKLHRMKTNAGTLETVIVASTEFLENLIKFNWGKAAKGLFAFKHRRIALLEGELTAPGNEIAYIVKAREQFTRKK